MRFTVYERDHAEYLAQWAPGVNVEDHIGRTVPLRIGDIGYTAILCEVETDADDYRRFTFDLLDSDLRWEALTAVMTTDPGTRS